MTKLISVSVQKFINEDRLPHLLFYGPPGTGKTSTILAIAKQLYTKKEFGSMVLEVIFISELTLRHVAMHHVPYFTLSNTRRFY
jgi:DNA polymerase III delta prime subunit